MSNRSKVIFFSPVWLNELAEMIVGTGMTGTVSAQLTVDLAELDLLSQFTDGKRGLSSSSASLVRLEVEQA